MSTVCGRQAHAHGRHKFLDLVLAHVGRVIPASVKTRRSISLYEFESKPTTSRMWTSGNSKTRRTATSEIARISPRFAPAKAMVLSAAMDESHTNDYTTLSVSEFDLKIYISLSLSLYIYIYTHNKYRVSECIHTITVNGDFWLQNVGLGLIIIGEQHPLRHPWRQLISPPPPPRLLLLLSSSCLPGQWESR